MPLVDDIHITGGEVSEAGESHRTRSEVSGVGECDVSTGEMSAASVVIVLQSVNTASMQWMFPDGSCGGLWPDAASLHLPQPSGPSCSCCASEQLANQPNAG